MSVNCIPEPVFRARITAFGLSPDEAEKSVISRENGRVCVDPDSPHFPSKKSGPGTELARLLSWFGIRKKPGCGCYEREFTMDQLGSKWCRENLDVINGWLSEEASRRNIPYSNSIGKTLILAAIAKAEKKEMSARNTPQT